MGPTRFTAAMGLGNCSNFLAEIFAILIGLSWATQNGYDDVWVVSDSFSAVTVFSKDKVPWEVNFSADHMAGRGSFLDLGQIESHSIRPPSLPAIEMPFKDYYCFS
ncbi:hypothetical protein BVC80_8989g30 [Macleaya cordata]|uniref:RNase H type-1 domain-containing protein n=1 Tax=Macleaya cordata TaxID=56857 RepID=A0A200Q8I0_MACCD|nr:hypothetical protein BVC80_8989g30 [Macleaya cordata]